MYRLQAEESGNFTLSRIWRGGGGGRRNKGPNFIISDGFGL